MGEVGSGRAHRQINCGSQGGPCDPSTQNHAGGTPASSLLRGYHTLLHSRRRSIRSTFPVSSGSLGSAAHPGIPSSALCGAEVIPNAVTTHRCALRFFYIQTLKKPWSVADTPYPKKSHRLPTILSREEVAQLIAARALPSIATCS